MGVKRELGTAQAPVDTVTQIIYLGSVHYWTVLPLQTVLFGVPASSFDPSKHVRRIYFVLCSWGCLLCLQHKKTIQFRERELNVILPQVNGDLCPATVIQAYLPLSHKRSSSPSTTTAYRNSISLYLLHIPSETSFHIDSGRIR